MNYNKYITMTEVVTTLHINQDWIDSKNITLLHEAVNLYIKIFSDPPYNEHFEFTNVENEFYQYIKQGCFILAIIDSKTVGFMCSSMGLDHIGTEVAKDMLMHSIDYKKDVYISELGVSNEHRCKGIAKKLMNEFMEINKYQNMFLRTGMHNNDHVIKLYEKYGFKKTKINECVMNTRTNGELDYDERFYMIKIQKLNFAESINNDGYESGAEHLYGLSGHYNNDINDFDNTETEYDGYGSGAEFVYE